MGVVKFTATADLTHGKVPANMKLKGMGLKNEENLIMKTKYAPYEGKFWGSIGR